jgi:hypothetical protein
LSARSSAFARNDSSQLPNRIKMRDMAHSSDDGVS